MFALHIQRRYKLIFSFSLLIEFSMEFRVRRTEYFRHDAFALHFKYFELIESLKQMKTTLFARFQFFVHVCSVYMLRPVKLTKFNVFQLQVEHSESTISQMQYEPVFFCKFASKHHRNNFIAIVSKRYYQHRYKQHYTSHAHAPAHCTSAHM